MKRSKIEWIDKKSFVTRCDCLSPEHDIFIEVEKDTELDMLFLSIYTELSLKNTYYKGIKNKLRACWRILTNKPVTFESDFIFRGYEHARDFCEGIMDMAVRLKKD